MQHGCQVDRQNGDNNVLADATKETQESYIESIILLPYVLHMNVWLLYHHSKDMKRILLTLLVGSALIGIALSLQKSSPSPTPSSTSTQSGQVTKTAPPTSQVSLSISALRARSYPGNDLVVEQTLSPHESYTQYIASYMSDGLKIYGLLTIPKGTKPSSGWPVILFNHGYLDPVAYTPTARYVAYVDGFAKHGYIVFKPDYRGHGKSEGTAQGAYYDPGYLIDDLNALSSLKKYKDSNPTKIGVFGHSMGGNITLRDLVITHDFKAAVIWGGVVGSYTDLLYNWENKVPFHPTGRDLALRINHRQEFLTQYGTPQANPSFWNSIDPTAYLRDITTPIQLDVGGTDEEVPIDFSKTLRDNLQSAGKTVEYYEYPGSNHNISQGFDLAMEHSLAFFDTYVK